MDNQLKTIPKDDKIRLWKSIYANCQDWLSYEYATLSGSKHKRTRKSFQGAKMVCSELIDLIFSERPISEMSDDMQDIFNRSAWDKNIQQFSEKSLALGGGALKLYSKDNEIYINFVDADKFIPISWSNEKIIEADFLNYTTNNGKKYLTIESHRKIDDGYNIKNRYYLVGDSESLTSCTPTMAGVPISETYEKGVDVKTGAPLFSYFKLPQANNLDFESPKSISVYANATATLEGLDIAFDSLQSELVLGRKRIIVPAQAVRKVVDENGNRVTYFDPADEIFQAFEGDDKDQLKITDTSVELRIDEIRQAIQTYLDILSIQIGFSAGYLTFDGQSGVKTATEVISENSKTHKTKVNLQESLSDCIDGIVESIQGISGIFKINANDFSYQFQDNIIEDRASKTAYWTGRLNSGTATLEEVLINLDGLSKEEAKKQADLLREQNATVSVDSTFGGLDN